MGIYTRTNNSRYYTLSALKLKSFTHARTTLFKSKLSRRRSALKHKQFHKLATASAIHKRSIARKIYKACYRVGSARAVHAARPAPVPTLVTRSIPPIRGLFILQVPKTGSSKRKRAQREHVSPASSPISPHGAARSSYTHVDSEASTSRATLDVGPSSPRSGGPASLPLFPASGDSESARWTSSSFERCETPEPDEVPHVQPVPAPPPVSTPKPMSSLSLSTRVPYRQPAPPPAKSSSTKPLQPKRRRLANAYKEGVIKSALRRALLAHHRSSSSSPAANVGLGLVAGVLARAKAAMGVANPSSASQPSTLPVPVPPSSSSRSIFAAIPTPMPLPAKGTPPSFSSNTQRGVLRPRKRLQLGPWLVLVERRMKLKQVLGGKGKQVVPLPKLKPNGTGLSVPVVGTGAKDVKPALRREGSTLLAC